jgi:DNA processing protein
MDEKLYWVGFNLVKGIGSVRLRALKGHFGKLSQAWEATPAQLHETGLSSKIIDNIIQIRSSIDLEKYYGNITSKGISIITSEEDNYPSRLKEIDQPPPVLYLRGIIKAEDFWAVAIVGTRRVTAYGRQVTDELATYLAHNKWLGARGGCNCSPGCCQVGWTNDRSFGEWGGQNIPSRTQESIRSDHETRRPGQ